MLRKTDHYIWNIHDEIGRGATGSVYKCRHQESGKIYAAKELNKQLQNRWDVIRREISMLTKLKHENIVQFIEFEYSSEQYVVIIMELCEKSLHDVIQKPENEYGLNEQDYKDVICDISAGMEYLRNNNVIHRDVKPGNILQVQNLDNGRFKYKISDFGAARDLKETEQFVSIYGTEEYLHPDIYEKAIMKYTKGPFNSTVDLWSLGVTYYHLATGMLPFKPFHGRSDKRAMHHMLTQKGPGVISCIQQQQDGPIEYSKELPIQTRISKGLKFLITPILRGLLETRPKEKISYEDFFQKIKEITTMKEINVYCNKNSCIERIYINPDYNLSHLQDALASFTGIKAMDQELYHNIEEFKPSSYAKISTYPEITEENPLILISNSFAVSVNIEPNVFPTLNYKGGKQKSRDEDFSYSKMYVNHSCHLTRETEKLQSECAAIFKAQSIYRSIVKRYCYRLASNCEEIRRRATENWKHMENNSLALNKLSSNVDNRAETIKAAEKYNELLECIDDIINKITELRKEELFENIWLDGISNAKEFPSPSQLSGYKNVIKDIHSQFFKDSRRPPSVLDDLVHHSDRRRLPEIYQLMREKVLRFQGTWSKLHDSFNGWLTAIMKQKIVLREMEERTSVLFDQFHQNYQSEADQFANKLANIMDTLLVPIDQQELLNLAKEASETLSIIKLDEKPFSVQSPPENPP